MNLLKSVMEFLHGEGGTRPDGTRGSGNFLPPLSPEGRAIAGRAVNQACVPHQADESHILFCTIGEDGDVVAHSEQLERHGTGLKSVEKQCLVTTVSGVVVSPKDIRIQCLVCHGFDTVGSHCRCGIAICRRHTFRDPVDGSPLCPDCHLKAVESFDTWAAHDRRQTPKQPES